MSDKQTAVDWFYEKLITGKFTGTDTIDFLFETAKEIEKQQIMKAYTDSAFEDDGQLEALKYYKENYER